MPPSPSAGCEIFSSSERKRGPLEGRQQTFVLRENWVPEPRRLSADEALRELAIRYFTGHGPATLPDFGWWSGLTITEAKKAVAAADGVLFSETIGGTAYLSGGEKSADDAEVPDIALLAGYDEYLLGYKDRSAVLKPEHAPKIVPGTPRCWWSAVKLRASGDGRSESKAWNWLFIRSRIGASPRSASPGRPAVTAIFSDCP